MLSNIARLCGVSLASLALAQTAMAQDANVTTGATSAKLGGEFRAEWVHDDHGYEKATGFTPTATDMIQVQRVALKYAGNLNANTEFAMRFNLLNVAVGAGIDGNIAGLPLEYGYGTHWFTKAIGFSMGKMKVAQGGWNTWDSSYREHAKGVYSSNLVFADYSDMIEMQMKMMGSIRLQLLNDVSGANAEWNTDGVHPTWVLGWQGAFGPIQPVVDIGSYDNNKSRWIDVGVKTEMSGLVASLDIYMKNDVHKFADPTATDKNKEIADAATSITLNAAYAIKGTATPFLFFSTFDNKQGTDSDIPAIKEEPKVNTTVPASATSPAMMVWNDNGQTFGVGANLDMMGKNFNPYFAIVSQSGKFADAAGKEETKSNMWIKLGVLGEI